ncbi:albusnodin/ikarugamycin family macrolactam cyclase [Streptomyces albidoflavus]|nr:albusnodin/ikarugamycin family macrolactam cyclase [Streptomyces albidoflavus]
MDGRGAARRRPRGRAAGRADALGGPAVVDHRKLGRAAVGPGWRRVRPDRGVRRERGRARRTGQGSGSLRPRRGRTPVARGIRGGARGGRPGRGAGRRGRHGAGVLDEYRDRRGVVDARPGPGRPDRWRARPRVAGAYLRDQRVPAARSAFAGVHRVPPGHRLVLTRRGASLSPWWSAPTPGHYEVAVARLRTALTGAVRVRTGAGEPVSTDLAGTDSTTLTVLAERFGPVTGITAHPRGVTAGGDLDFARALILPQLTRRTFELTDRHLPFAEAELPATDQPPLSAHLWGMFSAQLAAGLGVHLTGDGGDHLFQPAPTHLAELVAHGRLLRAVRDAGQWARARRISPVPLLRQAAGRDVTALATSGPGAAAPWLTPDTAYDRDPVDRTAAAALVDSLRAAARHAHADTELAASIGVELHNPYHDAAVLDAVLAARSWDRVSSIRYKPMLVDALGDLLPARHRDRTTKGTFETSFHTGVRARLPHLLDHCDGRLAALGLIRPDQLRAALHRAALGARTPWRTIVAAYGAETWLRAVDDAPAPSWTAHTTSARTTP